MQETGKKNISMAYQQSSPTRTLSGRAKQIDEASSNSIKKLEIKNIKRKQKSPSKEKKRCKMSEEEDKEKRMHEIRYGVVLNKPEDDKQSQRSLAYQKYKPLININQERINMKKIEQEVISFEKKCLQQELEENFFATMSKGCYS